jgi:hypothetical protein
LWKQGSKLYADIVNMPFKFSQLIRAGAYRRLSPEVYHNYQGQDGKIFRRVLKSVSVLGNSIPAIPTLAAVEALYHRNESGMLRAYDSRQQEFRAYTEKSYTEKEPTSMATQNKPQQPTLAETWRAYDRGDAQAGNEISRLVSERVVKFSEPYREALANIREQAKNESRTYERVEPQATDEEVHDAGIAIDTESKKLMAERGISYRSAFDFVLASKPHLCRAYQGRELSDSFKAKAYANAQGSKRYADSTIEISKLVGGLPRLADGAIDIARAVPIVNASFLGLAQSAAQARLQTLAVQWQDSNTPAGLSSQTIDNALQQARREHPDLARLADGGQANEISLRDLLWAVTGKNEDGLPQMRP